MSRHRQHGLPRRKRHPFDWYVEPAWAVEALFDARPIIGTVGDPACGQGTIPEVARARGHFVVAADIVDRGYPQLSAKVDFLSDPSPFVGIDNIITNPPYSYRPGIAEAFVRQAIALRPQLVAIVVPVKWVSSEVRFTLFSEFPPLEILIFSERPSMPPGDQIEALASRAFKGGAIDYCWILWEPHYRGPTTTRWLPPRPKVDR